MSKIGIIKLKKYQTFNGKGILRKYSNEQPKTKKVSYRANEMPEPILEPKITNSVAFGYTTHFLHNNRKKA